MNRSHEENDRVGVRTTGSGARNKKQNKQIGTKKEQSSRELNTNEDGGHSHILEQKLGGYSQLPVFVHLQAKSSYSFSLSSKNGTHGSGQGFSF